MWEDDQNRLGGRWLINLNKNARSQELDRIWLELVSSTFFIHIGCHSLLRIQDEAFCWNFLFTRP